MSPTPPPARALEERPFALESEDEPGRVIRGRVVSPAGAEASGRAFPTVILLHGFKGFMDWGFFPELARRLVNQGVVTLAFNMSGGGIGPDLESFDDGAGFEANCPSRELQDMESVRGLIHSGALPWVDPTRLGLLGHSMGGAVALLHAAEHGDYRAVVTWAAVSTFDRFTPEAKQGWRSRGFLEIPNARTGQTHRLGLAWLDEVEGQDPALDPVAACSRLHTPTLLLHGTGDESVPYAEGERLAHAGPHATIRLEPRADAGHTFGARHPLTEVPPDLAWAFETGEKHLLEHLQATGPSILPGT